MHYFLSLSGFKNILNDGNQDGFHLIDGLPVLKIDYAPSALGNGRGPNPAMQFCLGKIANVVGAHLTPGHARGYRYFAPTGLIYWK